jgi:hypothetical protein
MKSAGG